MKNNPKGREITVGKGILHYTLHIKVGHIFLLCEAKSTAGLYSQLYAPLLKKLRIQITFQAGEKPAKI